MPSQRRYRKGGAQPRRDGAPAANEGNPEAAAQGAPVVRAPGNLGYDVFFGAGEPNPANRVKYEVGSHFVNPYTFVPLRSGIDPDKPRGHASGIGGLSGYAELTFQMLSPFILPADVPFADRPEELVASQHITMPGSSVKGAVRSVHEVIAGGCLRVFDPDYVPIHRETLPAPGDSDPDFSPEEDRLAVVTALDPVTNRVTHVQPAFEYVWIPRTIIHSAIDAQDLKSGDRLNLTGLGDVIAPFYESRQALASLPPTGDGGWVVHVTDAQARPKEKDYRFACGRVTPRNREKSKTVEITDEAWQIYVEACMGTRDVQNAGRLADLPPGPKDWIPVEHVYQPGIAKAVAIPIGKRRPVTGRLALGDTVWLTVDGRLKMAALWRRRGRWTAGERVPATLREPCSNPESLCPSCAVFGSAEIRRNSDASPEKGRQASYQSHVRFGEFRSTEPATPYRCMLAPLRSPKPSAGNMYLVNPTNGMGIRGKPSAHWGSRLDGDSVEDERRLAGRKFYWHGQLPATGNELDRQSRRSHHNALAKPDAPRWAVSAKTCFNGRVWFDNLSELQLGYLLMALNPESLQQFFDQLPNGEQWATHLGGAKPLGFGSAVLTKLDVHIESAAARYSGEQYSDVRSKRLWISSVRAAGDALKLDNETDAWIPALRAVLNPYHVAADRIWYPTKGNFKRRSTPDDRKEFDASFEWFSSYSGGEAGIPQRSLPRADAADPYLPGGN